MKKHLLVILSSVLLLTSCGTYTGMGAYIGARTGEIFGSSVGGLIGGHRGYYAGSAIGMVGGAIVGAAIGAESDRKQEERAAAYRDARRQNNSQYIQENSQYLNSRNGSEIDETNSGDDRIDFTPSSESSVIPENNFDEVYATSANPIEIRNLRFLDDTNDEEITAGESAKISFEVYNVSQNPMDDVCPMVDNASNTKFVTISAPVKVERIAPGRGIRYTAMIATTKSLRPGSITFKIYVRQGSSVISNTKTLDIITKKK